MRKQQITLGGLIKLLEGLKPDLLIPAFGKPHSYRGYYSDLAFEELTAFQSTSEILGTVQGCRGRTFIGYKGGEYVMGEGTFVWIAQRGCCGVKLFGLDTSSDSQGEATLLLGDADDWEHS